MTTTIKVQYVNQPKSPKGPGSIKTDDGTYYKCWVNSKHGGAVLADFSVGGEYEIEYSEEQYNGKPQRTVTKIVSGGGGNDTSRNGGSQPNAQNKAGATSDRSARIERQHSQEMALRMMDMIEHDANPSGDDWKASARHWTDYFQSDLNNSPTTTAVSVSTDIEDVNAQLQEAGW